MTMNCLQSWISGRASSCPEPHSCLQPVSGLRWPLLRELFRATRAREHPVCQRFRGQLLFLLPKVLLGMTSSLQHGCRHFYYQPGVQQVHPALEQLHHHACHCLHVHSSVPEQHSWHLVCDQVQPNAHSHRQSYHEALH